MKNMLFTGIIGENPAVPINREQAPGIGMPLLNKDGGEKYHCRAYAVLRCYRFTTLSDVAKRKINTRDNTVSKASPLLESSLHRITEFISRRPCLQPPKPGWSEKNTYNCH